MKPITISIGIPAYNEEHNIAFLLAALQRQTGNFRIREIIIVADGCTDATVREIRRVSDPRIMLITHATRKGLPATQNAIVKRATGDVLVLLNADVLPIGTAFIAHLIKPFLTDASVGLTCAAIETAQPRSLFEHVVAASYVLKKKIFLYSQSTPVYLCHGRARALSRTLYSNIRWPAEYSEDAFSYFFAKMHGYRAVYVPSARVLFRAPQTLRDYLTQSTRFYHGRRAMEQYFPADIVQSAYAISPAAFATALLAFFTSHPAQCLAYCALALYARLVSRGEAVRPQGYGVFDIATSSKKVLP